MTQQNSRQAERGFTLVELAIVMIIIGLLIGGILKGQELIANSRVTSTVAQIKGVDAAITTFRDQYNAMPGDMLNPTNRLPNCTDMCATTVGDGDNLVENGGTDPGLAVGNATESAAAFVQLAAAGVLGGVQPSAPAGAVATGITNPSANVGGALSLAYGNVAQPTGAIATGAPSGHYLVNLLNPGTAADTGVIQAKAAGNIDSKLDDGLPNTGSVRAGGAAACANGTATDSIYDSSVEVANCTIFARVQQ